MDNYKHIDNLFLEVTRRCSCVCEHCLRGNAMDLDMTEDMLPLIFKHIKQLNLITFTGGEPSLNISIIQKTLDYCRNHHIFVSSVWLATNGLQNQAELIEVMNNWLDYCLVCTGYADAEPVSKYIDISDYKENYLFGLACSIDEFHSGMDKNIYQNFKRLAYYDHSKEGSFFSRSGYKNILLIGNAAENELNGIEPTDCIDSGFFVYDNVVDTVYISTTGYVYNNCDYSYSDMDKHQNDNSIFEYDIFEIAQTKEYEELANVV